jgi:hypothetical protein
MSSRIKKEQHPDVVKTTEDKDPTTALGAEFDRQLIRPFWFEVLEFPAQEPK